MGMSHTRRSGEKKHETSSLKRMKNKRYAKESAKNTKRLKKGGKRLGGSRPTQYIRG
jgi:hypothetical protein